MFEIDLHGLMPSEALTAFVDAYNRCLSRAIQEMHVVHGYGSSGSGGVIRRQLRAFLEQHSSQLEWISGETADGNPGYTIVHPRKPLPVNADQLDAGVLQYCATPRTETKIAGEFRRHTAKEVKETIRRLTKQGKLKEIVKAGHKAYQSG